MIDDRNETKRGMWWLGSATAVTRLIDLAASLVVLGLLTQKEMGTAALVLSAGAVVESVSGMGLGHALIQARNLTKDEEQSLFWLAGAIGLGLGLLLAGAAPFVAAAYELPLLVPMVVVTGLKLWLVGMAVVPQQLLSKHLMFREAGAVQALSTLGEALTKIALAILGFGAWAIVIGNVFRGVVLLTMVLAFSRFRPRLHFAWGEVRGYLRFGTRIAASGLLYQSYRNADYFLVGKILGLEVLGVYRVAFDLGMQPLEVLINLINRVSYPIYVKLSHDARALKDALVRSTRSLTLLAAPAVAFLFMAVEDVLALVTHNRWAAAAPGVRVLVWAALLRGAAHLFPQIYVAAGRPSYAVVDSAASLVVLVGAFWLGLTFLPELGMLSVCWAWLVVYPVLLTMHLALTRRITPLGTFEYLRAFAPGLGGAVVMTAAMLALRALGIRTYGELIAVFAFAAAGGGAYAGYLRVALNIGFKDLVPKKSVAPAA